MDNAIIEAVKGGKDIVLTGNPGDGKTHIIRMLKPSIDQLDLPVEIILDASTLSNSEIYQSWHDARESGKSYIIAVNAAVLYSVFKEHEDFAPLAEAYKRMTSSVVFHDESENDGDVIVFDLSKREVLTPDIIAQAICKMTDEQHYHECDKCPLKPDCVVTRNRKLLNEKRFQERLYTVARASEISYTQMHKSINRFYAWGYAKWLEENGYDKTTLADSETPTYESAKKLTSTSQDELTALWDLAKEQANAENENDARISYGETMYDMIALDASSHPVNYLKVLGTSSGILYPPDKLHPNKRFVLSQDVLEMMIRSSVSPNEIINGQTIRERLWNRFGVIIGGSRFELEKISKSGMIMQVDEDALEENFASFAATLEAMDFAEEMADGILQIRLGGG